MKRLYLVGLTQLLTASLLLSQSNSATQNAPGTTFKEPQPGDANYQIRQLYLHRNDSPEAKKAYENAWQSVVAKQKAVEETQQNELNKKCPVANQVYMWDSSTKSLGKAPRCLPAGWEIIPLGDGGCPAGYVPGAPVPARNDICVGPRPSTTKVTSAVKGSQSAAEAAKPEIKGVGRRDLYWAGLHAGMDESRVAAVLRKNGFVPDSDGGVPPCVNVRPLWAGFKGIKVMCQWARPDNRSRVGVQFTNHRLSYVVYVWTNPTSDARAGLLPTAIMSLGKPSEVKGDSYAWRDVPEEKNATALASVLFTSDGMSVGVTWACYGDEGEPKESAWRDKNCK